MLHAYDNNISKRQHNILISMWTYPRRPRSYTVGSFKKYFIQHFFLAKKNLFFCFLNNFQVYQVKIHRDTVVANILFIYLNERVLQNWNINPLVCFIWYIQSHTYMYKCTHNQRLRVFVVHTDCATRCWVYLLFILICVIYIYTSNYSYERACYRVWSVVNKSFKINWMNVSVAPFEILIFYYFYYVLTLIITGRIYIVKYSNFLSFISVW